MHVVGLPETSCLKLLDYSEMDGKTPLQWLTIRVYRIHLKMVTGFGGRRNLKPPIFHPHPIDEIAEFNGRLGIKYSVFHIPSGKHTKNYGKIHHAINGKINYFDWAMASIAM